MEGTSGNPQSQNGYNFANVNPINLSDPLGLWTVDLSTSASIGVAGLVGGVLFSQNGIYTYGGIGVATPGLGGSLMWSPSDPSTGISTQYSAGFIAGGQYNLGTDGSKSGEIGLSTEGLGVYATKTNILKCF